MSGLRETRRAVSAFAIAAMLSGCGLPSGMQQAQGGVAPSGVRADIPACGDGRSGQAQCDATVRAGARYDISGWTAKDLQSAYKLPSSTKGSGQIVAVVDAYDNPNVASDLAEYRSTFGLPKANFTKYNQDGVQGNYPQGSAGWGVEIDLDVDMVSASCPKCTIYLVEANSNTWSDLETAESEAVKLGAHIISNSFGGSGASQKYFDTRGVTYLGVDGDNGFGISEPADFDSVVAVGGTRLFKGGGKRGWHETVDETSGRCATGIRKPSWQHDAYCKYRLANDVAAVAEGVAAYDTYDHTGWILVDGSPPAGFLAGVFGLAGNPTQQRGGRTFWQPAHQQHLFTVAGGGTCSYALGRYNTCTGWGTPDGAGAF